MLAVVPLFSREGAGVPEGRVPQRTPKAVMGTQCSGLGGSKPDSQAAYTCVSCPAWGYREGALDLPFPEHLSSVLWTAVSSRGSTPAQGGRFYRALAW